MDLAKVIQELRNRKALVEQAIAQIQGLIDGSIEPASAAPSRRGRKFMDEEERQEVSARMRNYWENRRKRASSSSS